MLALLLLVTFAPTAFADEAARVLAPYERTEWADFLKDLRLDPGKAYVLIVQVPSAYPIDLRTPETARRSLLRNVRDPSARIKAKTLIGHTMVGWQCSTGKGLISKSGEKDGQAMRMALSGWGLTPLLSTYLDGHLVTLDDFPWRHADRIRRGKASILAAQISERSCQALRRYLVRYITNPLEPAKRFSWLLDVDGFEGDGCASFALTAASKTGLFAGILERFNRRISVYDGLIGWKTKAPNETVPFVKAANVNGIRIIRFSRLVDGPWDSGNLFATFDVVDPELIFAGIMELRRLAGERGGALQDRALSADDPAVRRLNHAIAGWAKRHYRHFRFVEGIGALVLER